MLASANCGYQRVYRRKSLASFATLIRLISAESSAGDNNTSLEILARISAGLGVTLKDLLDFECELPLPVDDASTLAVLAHMRAFTPEQRELACRLIRAIENPKEG